MLIKVKVVSAASENAIYKKASDCFEVYTKAKPVQGQANRAVADLLSKHLGKKARLVRGFKQTNKVFETLRI